MKSRTGAVVVVLLALASGLAFSQSPAPQDPAETRIDKLEQDLAAAKLRMEAMSTEFAETKTLMAAAAKYADAQAKAASSMAAVLDEAERAGFTYGINADSRHILLRGWRDQLAVAQKDVPTIETPPVVPTKLGRRSATR
jgi:hypothetical protein